MDTPQILGWIATTLFSIMIIPQIIKTIKSKDTSGVSLLLFIIYFIANVDALVYALLIGQRPLVVKYTIALVTTAAYIGIYFYFEVLNRRKQWKSLNSFYNISSNSRASFSYARPPFDVGS